MVLTANCHSTTGATGKKSSVTDAMSSAPGGQRVDVWKVGEMVFVSAIALDEPWSWAWLVQNSSMAAITNNLNPATSWHEIASFCRI